MGGEEAARARAHILAIPFHLFGHIMPTIQLCSALACHGFSTTLVLLENNAVGAKKALQSRPSHVRAMIDIKTVSLAAEQGAAAPVFSWEVGRTLLRSSFTTFPLALRPLLDDLIHGASSTNTPPLACVLSDTYLSWTQDVARELGVPRVSLWISCAAEFQIYLNAGKLLDSGLLPFKAPSDRTSPDDIDNLMPGTPGKAPMYHRHYDEDTNDSKRRIQIPGVPPLGRGEFPTFLQIEDTSDPLFFQFVDSMRHALEADMILFNSFTKLEEQVLKVIQDQHPQIAYPIGPLFLLEEELLVSQHQDSTSHRLALEDNNEMNNNDTDALQWLDKHAPNSVIYVGFGSTIPLSDPQIEEIGLGLQASQQPFLWALRVLPGQQGLSTCLKENLDKSGLIVEWAPQTNVLAHPSVGAFLSHCGWGSTLESICVGVPMLACPMVADSPLVSKLLEELDLAIKLPKSSREGIAKAEDVANLTKEILLGDKGRECRKRAKQFSVMTSDTVKKGGSSRATLDTVVEKLYSFAMSHPRAMEMQQEVA